MTRVLPESPNLDHLKNEAKRILRSLKDGDATHLSTLANLAKYRDLDAARGAAGAVSRRIARRLGKQDFRADRGPGHRPSLPRPASIPSQDLELR